jgi:hypothetical protein
MLDVEMYELVALFPIYSLWLYPGVILVRCVSRDRRPLSNMNSYFLRQYDRKLDRVVRIYGQI